MFCFFFGSPGICTPCTPSICIWIHIYCTLVYRMFSGLLSSVEVFEDASFYPGKRGWGGGWGGALGSCKSQGSNNIAQITWQSSGWGWEGRWGLRKIWNIPQFWSSSRRLIAFYIFIYLSLVVFCLQIYVLSIILIISKEKMMRPCPIIVRAVFARPMEKSIHYQPIDVWWHLRRALHLNIVCCKYMDLRQISKVEF